MKVNPNRTRYLGSTWSRTTGTAFSFVMLDDLLHATSLQRAAAGDDGSVGSFCIIMASLGLFAMTALTTEQRSKEIGIRKSWALRRTRSR